jgi:hypothetical protein
MNSRVKHGTHLEIRDRALIRFLHANGDITKLSTWQLEAVNRAINDDYEKSTTTGENVVERIYDEFYARLEKVRTS